MDHKISLAHFIMHKINIPHQSYQDLKIISSLTNFMNLPRINKQLEPLFIIFKFISQKLTQNLWERNESSNNGENIWKWPPLLDPYHMENSVCSKMRQLIDHCILSPNLYSNVRHRLNVMSGLILQKRFQDSCQIPLLTSFCIIHIYWCLFILFCVPRTQLTSYSAVCPSKITGKCFMISEGEHFFSGTPNSEEY